MRFASYSLALSAGLGLLGCSSSSAPTTSIVRPQLLAVLPEDFLGPVRCSPDFGSMGDAGSGDDGGSSANEPQPSVAGEPTARSYVATLSDVTPKDDGSIVPFDLASSPPTRCTQPVTFSFLITNHDYVAHVEAYTESAEALTPYGAGSPLLVDANGQRVRPRWSADCRAYPPSPAAGGAGGAGGSSAGGAGAGAGGTLAQGGTPGVQIFDTVTQTPHDCGVGLAPIE